MQPLDAALAAHAQAPHELAPLRAVCEALIELGRDDELLEFADKALRIDPRLPAFVNWRAHALTLHGRHFDAVATWRNHAALPWKHSFYQMSLGQSLVMSGDTERGIPLLEQAWRAAVADGEAYARKAGHLYGEALLRVARPAGFVHWLERNRSDTGSYRPLDIPSWMGERDLRGKRVLVTHQMGYGDQFLLLACVAHWRAAGATLMITCDPQLHRLLQASLPDCVVVSAPRPLAQQTPLPDSLLPAVREFAPDMHASLLHLPMLAAQQTPFPSPYFAAFMRAPDAERRVAADWAQQLRAQYPGRALIGLFWDCNQRHVPQVGSVMRCSATRRSVPLREIERIVTHPSILDKRHFVSLHHPLVQHAAGMPSSNISTYAPGIHDFTDTAACIEQLDAVIAVDSGVANLSAMLGMRTVVPLNAASEWRWGVEGAGSPWIGKLRTLRQTVPGDWSTVVDEAIAWLGQ